MKRLKWILCLSSLLLLISGCSDKNKTPYELNTNSAKTIVFQDNEKTTSRNKEKDTARKYRIKFKVGDFIELDNSDPFTEIPDYLIFNGFINRDTICISTWDASGQDANYIPFYFSSKPQFEAILPILNWKVKVIESNYEERTVVLDIFISR
jgi:hypothetical protein